jgi:hypothetical protein
MVFLIFFSILMFLSVPDEVNIHGTRTVLFVSMLEECRFFLYSKEDHTLQYVVLSNEVGLNAFLLVP